MGWTSLVRLPIQKLNRFMDDENKNQSSIGSVLLITGAEQQFVVDCSSVCQPIAKTVVVRLSHRGRLNDELSL